MTLLLVARPYSSDVSRSVTGLPPPGMNGPWFADPPFTVTGGETTIYASDDGYKTGASESPPSQYFAPRLTRAYQLRATLFTGDEPSGGSRVSFGDIVLQNGDEGLDEFLTFGWDGHQIELLEGEPTAVFTDFTVVFRGTTAGILWDEDKLTIRLRDGREFFERAVQTNVYGGTGQLDGDANVEGERKPLTFGTAKNVPALLIDPAALVYQVHDGSIEDVTDVRDKGVSLVDNGDTTDVYSSAPPAGKYKTDLASGVFRLGSSPDGLITADVRGDNSGSYASTTAQVARRIVTQRLAGDSLTDPDDLDTGSFAQLNLDVPGPAGVFVGAIIDLGRLLDDLLGGVGAYWLFTRTGIFQVAQLKAPTPAIARLTLTAVLAGADYGSLDFAGDDELDGTALATINAASGDVLAPRGIARSNDPRPSHRRQLEYRRMWRVQSPDELAGGVSDADVALYSREVRRVSATAEVVKTKFKLARDVAVRSHLDVAADATIEVVRQQNLFGTRRDVYRVTVPGILFDRWLGEIVTLTSTRFSLSEGQDFVIIGIDENANRDEATLTLWG